MGERLKLGYFGSGRETEARFMLFVSSRNIIMKVNGKAKSRGVVMELFNIISGVCSIAGLLVSVFTASKVIKISQTFNCGNKDDFSNVVNKGKKNTYNGPYAGRDSINGEGNSKQK